MIMGFIIGVLFVVICFLCFAFGYNLGKKVAMDEQDEICSKPHEQGGWE